MGAVLLDAYQEWECPSCHLNERTRPLPPNASRFHPCPRLHGLNAPLVRAGMDCKVIATEREDYVGREMVQYAPGDGRPYAAIHTVRADGSNDAAVLAPCAQIRGGSS
jgi:hypothetical protein